jgi:DNA-binding transcriptional LysR family regulator
LDGAGLACVTEATIADHLAAGRLVRVLDDWCPEFGEWQLNYPTDRHMVPALRALINFLVLPDNTAFRGSRDD